MYRLQALVYKRSAISEGGRLYENMNFCKRPALVVTTCLQLLPQVVTYESFNQARREIVGREMVHPITHSQRRPIFNEQKNVLYIILTVER